MQSNKKCNFLGITIEMDFYKTETGRLEPKLNSLRVIRLFFRYCRFLVNNTAEQSSTDLTNTHRQPAPGEEGGVGRARVEGHLIVLLTGRLR